MNSCRSAATNQEKEIPNRGFVNGVPGLHPTIGLVEVKETLHLQRRRFSHLVTQTCGIDLLQSKPVTLVVRDHFPHVLSMPMRFAYLDIRLHYPSFVPMLLV